VRREEKCKYLSKAVCKHITSKISTSSLFLELQTTTYFLFYKMKSAILCSAIGALALATVPPRLGDQADYEYVVIGSGAGGGSVA
jgi:hypothetical protein